MRGIIKFLAGLIVIIIIGWLGLWWYAQSRMADGFTAWASQIAEQGWKLSYGGAARGSTPAAATYSLTDLSLTSPPDARGQSVTIIMPSFRMRIDVLDPLVLHADLPGTINFDIGASIDAAITFKQVALSDRLDRRALFNRDVYPFHGGQLVASGIDVLASQGSILVVHIDHLDNVFSFDSSADAGGTALAGSESFDGIAVAPLMTRLFGIPFGGKIAHLAIALNLSGPTPADLQRTVEQANALPLADRAGRQRLLVPLVHDWAAKGGHGDIQMDITVGPTVLTSNANLKFDQAVQPAGTAALTATHLDAFAATITDAYPATQPAAAKFQAELSPYLSTTTQDGQTLNLQIAYGAGSITINGQKLGPLPPVDWTTLTNPPPPSPAPAPAPSPAPTP